MRNPQMPIQITPHREILPTTHNITHIRPLTRMRALMHDVAGVPIEALSTDFTSPDLRAWEPLLRGWCIASGEVVEIVARACCAGLSTDTM